MFERMDQAWANKMYYLLILTSVGLTTCIDPFEPAYDTIENLVIIKGQISDHIMDTYVEVSESRLLLGSHITSEISDADVAIVSDQGQEIPLLEVDWQKGRYQPIDSFRGNRADRYHVSVSMADGRVYESSSVIIPKPVAIESVQYEFDPQGLYDSRKNQFIPTHRILADFQDPADEVNFYEWNFTLYRELQVCLTCHGGIYRGDSCIFTGHDGSYDYLCSGACWSITPVNSLQTFSDQFTDGLTVQNIEVGQVVYESRKGVLVDLHQYVISSAQYDFNRLLNQLTTESGSLDASAPPAIIGNIENVADPLEKVMGFFGAVARTDKRIYIDRSTVEAMPTGGIRPNLEPTPPGSPPPPKAPCIDNQFRTSQKPEGWP